MDFIDLRTVAPILHVMRHAQGYHSGAVTKKDGHLIRDAKLTPEGQEQCKKLCGTFDRHDNVSFERTGNRFATTDGAKIELLLSSPLRRALQTTALCFAPVIERGLKIVALPLAQEASKMPSDTGSELEVLMEEYPDVDLDQVKQGWWSHEVEYATDPKTVMARASKLRRFIAAQPEKEIALVSHGYFIHYLTGDIDEKGEQTTPSWEETELRTYTFVDGDEDAMIKETEESMKRRGAESRGRSDSRLT